MNFMLMATTAFLTVALYYLANSFEDAYMRSSRKNAILKFRNNRQKSLSFYEHVEAYAAEYNTWGYNAFADTDVTFSEFIDALKEKHSIEYSDAEEARIKKGKLTRAQIDDFTERMAYQEEFITAMESTLQYKNNGFVKQSIA